MSEPSAKDLVLFTGPTLLGMAFNWALLGILTAQVYVFGLLFPNERWAIKALVYVLYILDLFQTGIVTHFAWFMLVSGWGNPGVFLGVVPWPATAHPMFTGIVSAISQIYFAWRIWILTRGNTVFRCISVVIVLTALTQCGSAIVTSVRIGSTKDIAKSSININNTVKVWLGGSFAVDIVITATMILILSKVRSGGPVSKRTDALLKKLIVNTIETGAVTAVTAGIDLILFLVYSENYLHLVPSLNLSKLYAIVVIASLNGRRRSHNPAPIGSSNFRFSNGAFDYGGSTSQSRISRNMENNTIQIPADIRKHDDIECFSMSSNSKDINFHHQVN